MKHLIDKLRSNRRLDAEEYKALLLSRDTVLAAYLQELAREEVLTRFGNKIFIRGLIEITNRCRNNCYYCGIRKENRNIVRYELAQEEILSCCHEGYRLGFRTFVLQGGEAPVSYTHLDVYKRQMFINVGAIFAPFAAVGVRNWWLSTFGYNYDADLPALCQDVYKRQTGNRLRFPAITKNCRSRH